mmetsp:Transcript_40274/g.86438  ORF Transcript_40274/g.86438 Transcript_40274/m.86438 type:complete len:236 (+) Transcript_40274:1176-1883(+)
MRWKRLLFVRRSVNSRSIWPKVSVACFNFEAFASKSPAKLQACSSRSCATFSLRSSFLACFLTVSSCSEALSLLAFRSLPRASRSRSLDSMSVTLSHKLAMASDGGSIVACLVGTLSEATAPSDKPPVTPPVPSRTPSRRAGPSRWEAGTGLKELCRSSATSIAEPPCRRCAPTFICWAVHSSSAISASSWGRRDAMIVEVLDDATTTEDASNGELRSRPMLADAVVVVTALMGT